jgi:hypothetical protein
MLADTRLHPLVLVHHHDVVGPDLTGEYAVEQLLLDLVADELRGVIAPLDELRCAWPHRPLLSPSWFFSLRPPQVDLVPRRIMDAAPDTKGDGPRRSGSEGRLEQVAAR